MPLFEVVLNDPCALNALRDQPRLLALLVEGHRGARFGAANQRIYRIARSRRGSRPGSPLADAIFDASFAEPLAAIEQDFRDQG
eukprot:9156945-Pyramimonas_sp.AAC.1